LTAGGAGHTLAGEGFGLENIDIARIFDDIADLLELKGENVFRIRSYRRAARVIRDMPEEAKTLVAAGTLKDIRGIGESLAAKIEDILRTGTTPAYEEMKRDSLYHLIDLLAIPGVGPKLAVRLNRELGVENLADLEKAAKAGKLRSLEGMGEKLEEKILKGIEHHRQHTGRFKIADALTYAESIVKILKDVKGVSRADIAGSLRRRLETIGDIDILVTSRSPEAAMEVFTSMDNLARVLARGDTKSSIILRSGIQVDLRVLHLADYGAGLHYFTGSKDHNIVIRDRGKKMGLKVSEYGVFKTKTGRKIAGKTEAEVFKAVGLPFIPPEIRENNGEFEAADSGALPNLIELSDIKGDLQMHTKASDGANTIEEMGRYAKSLGYRYIAITDHSKAVRVAHGLNDSELAAHLKAIHRASRKVDGIEILAGVEVDILADGSLDLSDEVLSKCDVVLAAVHSKFNMPREEMTARVKKALSNPFVNVLAHPTGRIINEREPFEIDMEEIIAAARDAGVALELNSYPDRLDLKDVHCRAAKEAGAKLSTNTDSHADLQLTNMRYGVATARRGWLEPGDVINTYSLAKLKKFLAKRRHSRV
jgi:DNA polymerase (family 10)